MNKLYLKGLIFDVGGTLVSSGSLSRALVSVLDSSSATKIGNLIEVKISNLYKPEQEDQPEWLDIWRSSFAEFGVEFSEKIGREHLYEFLKKRKTYKFTIPLLEKLRSKGLKLAILSNVTGPSEIFDFELKSKGLESYFDAVVWSCDIGYRKPYFKSFKYTLDKLGLDKDSVLMVGDSEIADIEGAINFGLKTIKIVDYKDQSKSSSDYVIKKNDCLEEILKIIDVRK